MARKILIDAIYPNETRVASLNEANQLEEIEYETSSRTQIKSNIYLAKITRIEPSLQAAFIDYGGDKNGFLPFSEISPDYFNLPAAERESLKKHSAPLDSLKNVEYSKEEIEEYNSKVNQGQEKEKSHSVEEEIKRYEAAIDNNEHLPADIDITVPETEVEIIQGELNQSKIDITKQYKIQEVLKRGQVLLVQAQKEERGQKGASFTTYISLAGKYCVLMANKNNQNGISRRISNPEERRRLKEIISEVVRHNPSTNCSLIVRTAGIGRSQYEIKRDYDYLAKLWNKIREITLKSTAPTFIHREDNIIQKTIRDSFDHKTKEVFIEGVEAYAEAIEFVENLMPNQAGRIKQYTGRTPIFTKFNLEDQLSNLYQPIVNLPSGGYIVIHPTEALISIDVNSGKSTAEKNITETALKTNIEAAKEIAKQLRLRDLSGLIVIDFIDMNETKHKKIVEKCMRDSLSNDRARIQVGYISSFGLMELSRQRLRPSFLESNTNICQHCNGKGVVRADESNAVLIFRTIETEIHKGQFNVVNVYLHISAMTYILNNKRQAIEFLESKHGVKISFFHDHSATSDSFSIEKIKTSEKLVSANVKDEPLFHAGSELFREDTEEEAESPKAQEAQDTENQKPNKKSKRSKKASHKARNNKENNLPNLEESTSSSETQEVEQVEIKEAETSEPETESTASETSRKKKISRRPNNNRGSRRHNNKPKQPQPAAS